MTILFDNGPQVKLLTTDSGALWIKNVQFGQMPGRTQPGPPASFPAEEPPEPPEPPERPERPSE
jgi:hypothetical protein